MAGLVLGVIGVLIFLVWPLAVPVAGAGLVAALVARRRLAAGTSGGPEAQGRRNAGVTRWALALSAVGFVLASLTAGVAVLQPADEPVTTSSRRIRPLPSLQPLPLAPLPLPLASLLPLPTPSGSSPGGAVEPSGPPADLPPTARGILTGQVTGPDGTPAEGVTVTAVRDDAAGAADTTICPVNRVTTTGADGRYFLPLCQLGDGVGYQLTTTPGTPDQPVAVFVNSGQVTTYDVTLPR